jgi:biopolymer transport protein TolQ
MLNIIASMQPFTSAYNQSDLPGKLIIWSLVTLSIICWIVLIYKTWQAKKVKKASAQVLVLIEKNKNQLLNLEAAAFRPFMAEHLPHPFPQIYFALKDKTVEILNKKLFFLEKIEKSSEVYLTSADIDILEQDASMAIAAQYKLLEKNLFVLSTIYTLAPFLGLLGTVWGILITFSSLNSGGSAASNAAILGGISTALSTTVMGLVIAIPALISYNYLKNNLRHYTSDMESFLSKLISTIELQYRKADLS